MKIAINRRFFSISGFVLITLFCCHPVYVSSAVSQEILPPGEMSYEHASIGIYAPRGKEKAALLWTETLNWLNDNVEGTQYQVAFLDGNELHRAARNQTLDFIIAPSIILADIARHSPYSRIATERSARNLVNGILADAGVVVVSSQSPFKKLSEVKNATLWASSLNDLSSLGSLRYMYALEERDFNESFNRVRYTGFPVDAVLYRVRQSKNAVGVLPVCLYETMLGEGLINENDFKILNPTRATGMQCTHTTPLFPSWSLGASDRVPRLTITKTQTAFISIPFTSTVAKNSHSRGWGAPSTEKYISDFFSTVNTTQAQPIDLIVQWIKRNELFLWFVSLISLLIIYYQFYLQWALRRAEKRIHQLNDEVDEKRTTIEKVQRIAIVSELGSSLAHELNQPLESIMNYTHGSRLMAEKVKDGDEMVDALLKAESEVERASAVLKRLRSLIHNDDIKALQLSSPFTIVLETLDIFERHFKRHKVTVEHHAFGQEVEKRLFDSIGFQQIVVNVIKNALDAFIEAQTPNPSIDIDETFKDDLYCIIIRDNGPGLSPKIVSGFKAFYTTKKNGLGLGLSLCRQMAEKLHGSFEIANREGPQTGAQITIRFPFKKAQKDNNNDKH